MQCFCGTHLRALIAEYALCSVFPLTGFLINLHVHGADLQTLPAMDALILIAVDAQKREIAHRFEKNRNGTQVLAECPVILKQEGEHNTDKVIKRISGQEKPEHDLLQMCHLHQKQPGH